MGGCIHNPGEHSEWMKKREEKGFSTRMDSVTSGKTKDGKPVRQPGWAEMFVVMGVLAVVAILYLCGVFG